MADHALPAGRVQTRQLFPIHFGQIARDVLPFGAVRPQAEQADHGLIEIKNPPPLIHHQHTIFNRIEERLQESPFPRQSLDDRLQTFGVEPANSAQDSIQETGFARGLHQNHRFRLNHQ